MKVVIGVPCMDAVSASFFTSVLGQRYTPGHSYSYAVESYSMVYEARGRIAQRAIEAGADYLVWYDSDMVLEPDTTARLLDIAFTKRLDFLTGLYFMRRPPTKPLILKSLDWYEDDEMGAQAFAEVYEDYPRDALFPVAGCGFGCCVMRVEMVKDLAVRCRGNPFMPLPRLSEDYSFCWRAKAAGYGLWCDSAIRPGHAGLWVYGQGDWDGQRMVSGEPSP